MLIEKKRCALLIFNMQLEMVPLVKRGTQLLHDCVWLADVANTLCIPCFILEHKKLGKGSQNLRDVANDAVYFEKEYFDITRHRDFMSILRDKGVEQVLLAGCETHICVFQSAVALRDEGFSVFVLGDSVSSRGDMDHELALDRIQQADIQLVTREMFFFELVRNSENKDYIGLAMKFLDGRYIR